MGLFGNIFSKSEKNDNKESKEATSNINWIPLTSVSQFVEIKEKSKRMPQCETLYALRA